MAATTYQILYHATNENMNKIITNQQGIDDEQVAELYHNKHKIAAGNEYEREDATLLRDESMINGNSPECTKFQGLYEYAGSKRISKRNWIAAYDGYVIRDWEKIVDKITNTNFGAEDGDYSGDYLLFEGNTPENGIVVAKKNPILEVYGNEGYIIKNNNKAENGVYYKDLDEVKEELINATIAQIDFDKYPLTIDLASVVGPNRPNPPYFNVSLYTYPGASSPSYAYNLSVKIGTDASFIPSVAVNRSTIYNAMAYGTFTSHVSNGNIFVQNVQLLPTHLKKYKIPAHWETSSEVPYVVKDSYKRLQQEPWFVYSTRHSLTEALDVCRQLVEKIGLENVELIKVVPTDQFLKIK